MPFGKHKGEPMEKVPAQYLLWLWDNVLWNSKEARHLGTKLYVLDAYSALILQHPDYIPEHPPMD